MPIYQFSKHKIILLQGGIGNQLFQYSFGKFIENRFNIKVSFYFVDTKSKKAASRTYQLDKIVEHVNLVDSVFFKLILYSRLFKYFLLKFKFVRNLFSLTIDDDIHEINHIPDTKYYMGYWIDIRYAKALISLDSFLIKKNILKSIASKLLSEDIRKYNSVSIHIRRGDYLKLSNIYHILDKSYYNSAINKLKSLSKNHLVFYVFSDDIDYCKTIFEESDSFNFVDRINNPIEELILMSFCKNNIIANSTFSLWSSILNLNKDKICISPDKWLRNTNELPPIDNSYIKIII